MISQAVILGAGLGTRLRPITDGIPKVMVPINGKPLLEREIALLKRQGIKRFVINLHYLPEKITSYFGDGSQFGVNIVYSDETEKIMDTGGALKKMEALLDDQFLLVYGDHVHLFDFGPVVEEHLAKGALATLVLKRSDLPGNGEVIEIDPETKKLKRVIARPHKIHEFGTNQYLNSGLYVFSKEIVNYIPSDTPVHLDKEIIPKLVASNLQIYGFPTDEPILDINTLEKYKLAEEWYRKNAR